MVENLRKRIQEMVGYLPKAVRLSGRVDEELGGSLEEGVGELYMNAWREGALSRKDKHLLVLAMALGDDNHSQVRRLLEKCRKEGASERELMEVLELALWVKGVPTFVSAAQMMLGDGD